MKRHQGNEPLSPLERALLDRIQVDFPLEETPYESLGRSMSVSAQEVRDAIAHLRRTGVIRRIGGSFAPAALGYISTLVAAQVERDALESAAAAASAFPEVTHNYEREGPYNLWFTVVTPSEARLEKILGAVRACAGVRSAHSLPAVRTFKLRVDFTFERTKPTAAAMAPVLTVQRLDEDDRRIIARASGDLPDSDQPFDAMAAELGYRPAFLLTRLRNYRQRGILRRFGAILRHQLAGFVANGMSVWNAFATSLERLAEVLAARPEVSHCYERPALPDWPYTLYAMIHGQSKQQCLSVAEDVARKTGVTDYRVLFSLREFKKTSWQYDLDAD